MCDQFVKGPRLEYTFVLTVRLRCPVTCDDARQQSTPRPAPARPAPDLARPPPPPPAPRGPPPPPAPRLPAAPPRPAPPGHQETGRPCSAARNADTVVPACGFRTTANTADPASSNSTHTDLRREPRLPHSRART